MLTLFFHPIKSYRLFFTFFFRYRYRLIFTIFLKYRILIILYFFFYYPFPTLNVTKKMFTVRKIIVTMFTLIFCLIRA